MNEDANPRALPPQPLKGYRYPRPVGRTEAFVEDVRAKHGEVFLKAWLNPKLCQFQDHAVWTSDLAVKRLNKVCGDLIKKHSIVIKADEESRAHFRENVGALG